MTRYFWLGILFSSFLFAQTQVELSKQAKGVLAPGKGGTGLSSCPEGEGLTWQSGALVCSHTFTDLQDKGGQVFNVKAYGAVGDGVTDDIAALNSALTAADAADGAIIYFPPGTYILASTWDFSARENITVTGTQATLKAKDASNMDWMILVSASKHIIFDGLRLDGNFINQTTGAGRGISVSNSLDIQVLDSHVFNFNGAGSQSFAFFCWRSPNCVVRGSLFYNNGAGDIRMGTDLADGTRDFLLDDTDTAKSFSDNCVITDNRFGIFPFSEFSTATDWDRKNASRGAVQLVSTRGCVVSNNVMYSPSRDAVSDARGRAILCLTCNQNTITGNTVYNLGNGLGTISVTNGSGAVSGSGTDFSSASSTNTDINSFVLIEGDSTLYRITAVASATSVTVTPVIARATASGLKYKINMGSDLIGVGDGEGNTITGNSVWFAHDNGMAFGNNAVPGRSFQRNTISGNSAYFSYTSGFACDGNCSYNTWSGNVAMSNGQGRVEIPDEFRAGLHCLANADNNVVTGNVFADDQTSPTQLYGVAEDPFGTQKDNVYANNLYKGNALAPMKFDGANYLRDTNPYTHATLPAAKDGSIVYCSNCNTASSPCSSAGTGAMAFRENGQWNCK